MGSTFSSSVNPQTSQSCPPPDTERETLPPYTSARPPPYSLLPPSRRSISRRHTSAATNTRGPPRLSKRKLLDAFRIIADYLSQRNVNITIIASTDVVDIVHLDIFDTTDEVTFFNYRLASDAAVVLSNAVHEALKQLRLQDTSFLLDPCFSQEMGRRLTDKAIHQNAIIYRHGGLTVMAPPWSYIFCRQVEFITQEHTRVTQDLDDALEYLKEYLWLKHIQTVPYSKIRQWFRYFDSHLSRHILEDVNKRYRSTIGRNAIDFRR